MIPEDPLRIGKWYTIFKPREPIYKLYRHSLVYKDLFSLYDKCKPTTLRTLQRRLCNFIYLFLCTRWLHAWSRRFPEVSFMTPPRSDLHNGTCSLHHRCPLSLCYIFLQRFCFLLLYMQRKKRVQNCTCHLSSPTVCLWA